MARTSIIKVILLFVVVLSSTSSYAQKASDKLKPRWLHISVDPQNSTCLYDVITSSGSTISDARKESLSLLIQMSGMEGGAKVESHIKSSSSESSKTVNNNNHIESEKSFEVVSTMDGEPATLTARKIDEYWERDNSGFYHLATLYARGSVNKTPIFDDVKITTNYGLKGMWRSAICPGWGQLYKGSTLKGAMIMGGTVACIGAIVFTDCMRSSYASKINKTHSANLKLSYDNTRSNYAAARNICIGALGALYVYNIVDAIVAPGAKRILTSPAGANKFSYQWTPAITDDAGVGVVAQFTF